MSFGRVSVLSLSISLCIVLLAALIPAAAVAAPQGNAREYIVEQMGADGNVGMCGGNSGLLLLSSGDPRYLDAVRRIVRKIIPEAMALKPSIRRCDET